jgi:hypothetical protein
MSKTTGEDRYDVLERRHEEHQRAARDLAGLLGASEATTSEATSERLGEGLADAADRTPPPPPARRPAGARLRDLIVYEDAGDEYETRS